MQWIDSPQPVFQVLLIVTSFVLAWGEAWFLDCRVIPQEQHARNYVTGIFLLTIFVLNLLFKFHSYAQL